MPVEGSNVPSVYREVLNLKSGPSLDIAVSDVAILVTEAGLYRRSALCSPSTSPLSVVTINPWFSALKPKEARLSAYAATSGFRGAGSPGTELAIRGRVASSTGRGLVSTPGFASTTGFGSNPGFGSGPTAVRLGDCVAVPGSPIARSPIGWVQDWLRKLCTPRVCELVLA